MDTNSNRLEKMLPEIEEALKKFPEVNSHMNSDEARLLVQYGNAFLKKFYAVYGRIKCGGTLSDE